MTKRPQISAEMLDVIAYLEQRQDNAAIMERKSPEHAEWARERHRQLGIMIDEFKAGFHHGAAAARAALLAQREVAE